jgi:chaperonin GroEL (HSP60 family)
VTSLTQSLKIIKEIADSGVKLIIAGTTVGDLALHYLNRFNIAVIKVLSKFDLRRVCRVVNATPLARVGAPTPEEAGFVDIFETVEIGGDRVTVIRQLVDGDEGYDPTSPGERTRTATIVLRGATSNRLDDLERAIDDGVNVIKALLKDPRMVPGAGATEIELAKRADTYGNGMKGLSQHAVKRYASALEVVPRTLAENALGGAEGNEVLSRLWAKHEQKGGENWGVDVEVSSNTALSGRPVVVLTNSRVSQTVHYWPTRLRSTIHSRRRRGRSNLARKPLFRYLPSTASS